MAVLGNCYNLALEHTVVSSEYEDLRRENSLLTTRLAELEKNAEMFSLRFEAHELTTEISQKRERSPQKR